MPEKLFRVAGTSLSFLAVVAAAACMDSADSTGMVGAGDVTALFELPVAGQTSEFYALPFPNDLRRKEDGTLDLAGHSRDNNPTLETWINIFAAKTRGFGTNSAVYFRFSGTLDVEVGDGVQVGCVDRGERRVELLEGRATAGAVLLDEGAGVALPGLVGHRRRRYAGSDRACRAAAPPPPLRGPQLYEIPNSVSPTKSEPTGYNGSAAHQR